MCDLNGIFQMVTNPVDEYITSQPRSELENWEINRDIGKTSFYGTVFLTRFFKSQFFNTKKKSNFPKNVLKIQKHARKLC